MGDKKTVIIRFDQPKEQRVGDVQRVVGFVKVKNFIPLIDALDLDSNPRKSKISPITNDIEDSLQEDSDLFPFKTKGVLIAASSYEVLQRNRYRVTFVNPATEGILDGGHNTLAIGLYILRNACQFEGAKMPRNISAWDAFKCAWNEYHDFIDEYEASLRKDERDTWTKTELDVLVPVELLLPSDANDENVVGHFNSSLMSISSARNNNLQLRDSDKANHIGYYDSLKRIMQEVEPDFVNRVIWKSNEGTGDVDVLDIIAMAWLPLSLIEPPIVDEDGEPIDAPSPTHLYSGKPTGLNKFVKLMDSGKVTMSSGDSFHRDLKNPTVASALRVAVQLPRLYDFIYSNFPKWYNGAGGSYMSIDVVSKLNERRRNKTTPYFHNPVDALVPEGYIAPLLYGLRALMEQRENDDGEIIIDWREGIDPTEWLNENIHEIMIAYRDIIKMQGYDPQRVGKTPGSYNHVHSTFEAILQRETSSKQQEMLDSLRAALGEKKLEELLKGSTL